MVSLFFLVFLRLMASLKLSEQLFLLQDLCMPLNLENKKFAGHMESHESQFYYSVVSVCT
jgi:hypothetical protein